nr:hypothetical protein [Tanacetum cinerariifolium]
VAAVVGFGGGGVTMVGMDDGSGGYDDGAEMRGEGGNVVAAMGRGDGGCGGVGTATAVVGVMVAAAARGVVDRIDPVTGSLFGFARKSPPEKFSDGGGCGRPAVAAGGKGGWPTVEESNKRVCVYF